MRIEVIAGQLNASRKNSIKGEIQLADGQVVLLELSGNLKGQFSGRTFSFHAKRPEALDQIPADEVAVSWEAPIAFPRRGEVEPLLAFRQIGTIGDVDFRKAKFPLAPIEELIMPIELGETPPLEFVDLFYLEWYGQSGRVVAEIADAKIEWIDQISDTDSCPVVDPPNAEEFNPAASDEGEDEGEIETENSWPLSSTQTIDPYQLFPSDLDEQIRQSLEQSADSTLPPEAVGAGADDLDFDEHKTSQPRDWSEVMPGIDPETKALYESWDEIYSGQYDQPIEGLFCGEYEIPSLDLVQTDRHAETIIKLIVARLAPFNVAIDFCEHLTPLTALKMIVEEILPIAEVHPNLAATEIIQHYSTFEFCEACEKEMDEDYEKYHE